MPKSNPILHMSPDVVIGVDEIDFELDGDSYKKEGGQIESYLSSNCDIHESGIMSEVSPNVAKISETPIKADLDR